MVFPTMMAPITSARTVLPVTAAFKNTRLRPAWARAEIVVSSGWFLDSAFYTSADVWPGAIFTNTSDTEPGTRL